MVTKILDSVQHLVSKSCSKLYIYFFFLLDELGRGTATFDGTAIAKSVLDYLVNKINCTTLFVTHFKCLTQIFPTNQVNTYGLTLFHMGSTPPKNR